MPWSRVTDWSGPDKWFIPANAPHPHAQTHILLSLGRNVFPPPAKWPPRLLNKRQDTQRDKFAHLRSSEPDIIWDRVLIQAPVPHIPVVHTALHTIILTNTKSSSQWFFTPLTVYLSPSTLFPCLHYVHFELWWWMLDKVYSSATHDGAIMCLYPRLLVWLVRALKVTYFYPWGYPSCAEYGRCSVVRVYFSHFS